MTSGLKTMAPTYRKQPFIKAVENYALYLKLLMKK